MPEAGILKIDNLRNCKMNQRRTLQIIMALEVNLVRSIPLAKFI